MGNTFGIIDNDSTLGLILTFAGPACANVLYLSPVPVMKDIFMYKSTRELSVAPYVSMFLMCSLWVGYAQVVSEYAIFYSGIPGTFLALLYITIFSVYAKKSSELTKYFVTMFIHIIVVFALVFFPMDENVREWILSIAAVGLRILFLVSPFATLKKVLKTKSVDSLPFGLSFVFLLNGILWSLYGWLVAEDFVILISQTLAIVLSSLQLFLHVLYGDPIENFKATFRFTLPQDKDLEKGESLSDDDLEKHTANEFLVMS